jgi:IrrE N-terminal-like domain
VLKLDRMIIEEAGPNPERLAAAIHVQLDHKAGAIAVYEIAEALDIVEITEAPLEGIEGALLTTPDRNVGSNLVNSRSNRHRRRFTCSHELGHFLNLWHQLEDPSRGFSCTRGDLAAGWRKPSPAASRHLRQEAEANRFAIELLAPARLARPFLFGVPDLARVLCLSDTLEVSREAAARRYVELHEQPTALVFSTNGVVRYVERHPEFPFVSCRPGQRLSELPSSDGEDDLSAHVETDPRDWLARPGSGTLVIQTLRQQSGHAMTVLVLDSETGDDD